LRRGFRLADDCHQGESLNVDAHFDDARRQTDADRVLRILGRASAIRTLSLKLLDGAWDLVVSSAICELKR